MSRRRHAMPFGAEVGDDGALDLGASGLARTLVRIPADLVPAAPWDVAGSRATPLREDAEGVFVQAADALAGLPVAVMVEADVGRALAQPAAASSTSSSAAARSQSR